MTVSVVIPCGPMGFSPLVRCLASLNRGNCDEIIVCRFEAARLVIEHEVPVHEVMVPYVPSIARALLQAGFEKATSDWVLLVYPSEWLPGGDIRAHLNETEAESVMLPVVTVEDSRGEVPRDQTIETRLLRRSAPFKFDGSQFVAKNGSLCPIPIFSQPPPAFYFENGDIESAHRLSLPSGGSNNSRIERRIRVMARRELSKRRARDGLWALFEHMSCHEELWRLGEILKHLPYTLDDDPSIAEMRRQYAIQMGHLDGGAGDYYRDGAFQMIHSLDEAYVHLGEGALAHRCKWLIAECRKRRLKRVLELGSTDGNNLFPMVQTAKDLEFTGVEVSKEAVAHGHELAKATGVAIDLRNADSFAAFAAGVGTERCIVCGDLARDHGNALRYAETGIACGGPFPNPNALPKFDAVMLFEVLEHNCPEEGMKLVEAATRCARPGGRVFITTPCGSWSCHDDACWNMEKRKDHISAYSVERMKALLGDVKDLEISRVENPMYEEANSWVYASFAA